MPDYGNDEDRGLGPTASTSSD